jgi:hypothetical protein
LLLAAWPAARLAAQVPELPQPLIAAEEVTPDDPVGLIGDVPPSATDDFDPYYYDQDYPWRWPADMPRLDGFGRQWSWQFLPEGLMYRSYLAGVKESRFASVWFYEEDIGWLWDVSLGGRVGMLRYGTPNSFRPEGWQLDIEGAAFPRLDPENDRDLVSSDFRFGVPLTYAMGVFETKLAFYHLSSHLGDEYWLRHPSLDRINYSRDVLVLGGAVYVTDDVRLYGEMGYAVMFDGGSEPWEFQFGAEFSPARPTGARGSPFAAINAHLREEVDYGGEFDIQAGWQWRGRGGRHLFRVGGQYYNGKSPQYQFFTTSEEQWGLALWYDY